MIEQAVRILKHTNMNGKLLHCFFDVCSISCQLSHVCQIQARHEYGVGPHLSAKLGKRVCVNNRSIFQARRVMEQEIRLLNHKVKKAFLIRLLVHLADSDAGDRRIDRVLKALLTKSTLHPFFQKRKIRTVWRVRQGMVEAPQGNAFTPVAVGHIHLQRPVLYSLNQFALHLLFLISGRSGFLQDHQNHSH